MDLADLTLWRTSSYEVLFLLLLRRHLHQPFLLFRRFRKVLVGKRQLRVSLMRRWTLTLRLCLASFSSSPLVAPRRKTPVQRVMSLLSHSWLLFLRMRPLRRLFRFDNPRMIRCTQGCFLRSSLSLRSLRRTGPPLFLPYSRCSSGSSSSALSRGATSAYSRLIWMR